MKEVENSDGLLQFWRQAETTRVLQMAGAKTIWAHTRTEGVLDGVQFQLRQSVSPYQGRVDGIDASFILILDKALTDKLEKEEKMSERIFTTRFDDLMKDLARAVKSMGYWSIDMEFGTNLRFNLSGNEPSGAIRQDAAAALATMRADVPKIRKLFDAMITEAFQRINRAKASNGK